MTQPFSDTTLGKVLWQATAPAPPQTPMVEGGQDCDVAVIGGGLSGLATALELVRGGVDTMVLEAGEIGSGASGRNTGWWTPTWALTSPEAVKGKIGDGAGDRLMRAMVETARSIPDLARDLGIDCDANPSGVLLTAARQKTLDRIRTEADVWRGAGAEVVDLDRAALRAELVSDHYIGGLIYRDAGTFNPLAFTRGLARSVMAKGGRVHAHAPVQSVNRDGEGWRLALSGGEVRARRVVIAGGGSPGLPWVPARRSVYNMRVAMIASSPFPDRGAAIAPNGLPFTDMDSGDTFGGAFDPDGRLVMSIIPGLARNPDPAALAAPFWRKFRKVFPQAPEAIGWDFGWFGMEAVPADRMGKIYAPEDGLYIVQGYAGNGITQSVLFGSGLAKYVTNGDESTLPVPVSDLKAVPLPRTLSTLINRVLLPLGRAFMYR